MYEPQRRVGAIDASFTGHVNEAERLKVRDRREQCAPYKSQCRRQLRSPNHPAQIRRSIEPTAATRRPRPEKAACFRAGRCSQLTPIEPDRLPNELLTQVTIFSSRDETDM